MILYNVLLYALIDTVYIFTQISMYRYIETAELNMLANLENSAVPQDWKRSVFIPIPKKGNAKECSNYRTIALISHASIVMLKKFSKPGFTNMYTVNFQIFKLVLEKAEEPESKLPTSAGSSKKKRVPEKHLFLLY